MYFIATNTIFHFTTKITKIITTHIALIAIPKTPTVITTIPTFVVACAIVGVFATVHLVRSMISNVINNYLSQTITQIW
jgi:hypothetical protein